MDYFPHYKTNTIDKLAPGTCFAFQLGDRAHIGIAIKPYASGETELIDLCPGPPDYEGSPGVVAGKHLINQQLLVFPDVRIVLPVEREHIHFGLASPLEPAGALFLAGEDLSLAAFLAPKVVRVFDLVGGTFAEGDRLLATWFSSWEIQQRGPNGDFRTICRVQARPDALART